MSKLNLLFYKVNHIEHAVPLGDEMQNELLKEISTSQSNKLTSEDSQKDRLHSVFSFISEQHKKKKKYTFYEERAMQFDLYRRK